MPIGSRPRSDRRPRAQVGVGRKPVALPLIVPGLGERSLDIRLFPWSPRVDLQNWGSRSSSHGGVLSRERGPGAVRSSRSLSRAGAELSCRWRPPPGEGLRANAAGRLPRSPARPSGRLCRRAPQQRRLPCAVGVSASLVSGGSSGRGRGCGEGSPGARNPRPGLPSPLLPVPRGIPPTRGGASPGLPRGGKSRGALQGPDRRVAGSPESRAVCPGRPLQEGPRTECGKDVGGGLRAGAGEAWRGYQGGFLGSSCEVPPILGSGGLCGEKRPSFQLAEAAPWVSGRKGHLEERSCPAHRSAPAPLTQFLGP